LWCTDAVQDLGPVWQTDALEVTFHLANEDSESFDVKLRGTCGCTEVSPKTFTLKSGQKTMVNATIDLDRWDRSMSATDGFEETVMGEATSTSGQMRLLRMVARGTVRPSYQVKPNVLDFDQVIRGDIIRKEVTIRCLASSDADALEVISVPQGFKANVERLGTACFRLTVSSKPDVGYGRIDARIRFQARRGSERSIVGSVPLRGTVVDDIFALPPEVLMGTISVGESRRVTVKLQSHRQEEFAVVSVATGSDAITVDGGSGSWGTSAQYSVKVSPSSAGLLRTAVVFRTRKEGGESFQFELPVIAYVHATGE